jgi:hypothetical protein
MPNKTIYVSDDDLPLFQRAQELAGGTLSAAIASALRRYVEIEEGRQQGYDEVIVRVGPGLGRKQRFCGMLLAEMEQTGNERDETYRVYRTRTEKYVVHLERSEAHMNTRTERREVPHRLARLSRRLECQPIVDAHPGRLEAARRRRPRRPARDHPGRAVRVGP